MEVLDLAEVAVHLPDGLKVETTAPGYVTVTMPSIEARFLFTVPSGVVAAGPQAAARALVVEVSRVLVEAAAGLLRPPTAPGAKALRPGYLGAPD